MLHLFLISSPLQVIAAENIRLQYFSSSNTEKEKFYVFCEGDRLAKLFDTSIWTKIIIGKNTRATLGSPKKSINYNLTLLYQEIEENCESCINLYVSELMWLFNNVVFSHLKKKFQHRLQCAFFDEGLAMYTGNLFTWKAGFRSFMKYIWLKLAGFPSTLSFDSTGLSDSRINKIYCYHSQLTLLLNPNITEYQKKKLLTLDPGYVKKSHIVSTPEKFNKKAVLFLSQPLYNIISEAKYELLISEMIEYFRNRDYSNFYVKAHDGDTPAWIEKLVKRFEFNVLRLEKNVSIELLAPSLACGAVVGVCSSALLNLKLFGYQGEVVSYGFSCRRHVSDYERTVLLFEQVGVSIVK